MVIGVFTSCIEEQAAIAASIGVKAANCMAVTVEGAAKLVRRCTDRSERNGRSF